MVSWTAGDRRPHFFLYNRPPGLFEVSNDGNRPPVPHRAYKERLTTVLDDMEADGVAGSIVSLLVDVLCQAAVKNADPETATLRLEAATDTILYAARLVREGLDVNKHHPPVV
jgi:hypothetical protein